MNDDKCVLWLNRMAGIGKTMIVRMIVEQNKETCIASFFFSRDDVQASNSQLVLPSSHTSLLSKIPKQYQHSPKRSE